MPRNLPAYPVTFPIGPETCAAHHVTFPIGP